MGILRAHTGTIGCIGLSWKAVSISTSFPAWLIEALPMIPALTDEVQLRRVLFSDVVKPLAVASMLHVINNTTRGRGLDRHV